MQFNFDPKQGGPLPKTSTSTSTFINSAALASTQTPIGNWEPPWDSGDRQKPKKP